MFCVRTESSCIARLSWSFRTFSCQNNASSSFSPLPRVTRDVGKSHQRKKKDIVGPSVVERSTLKQHLDYIEATKEILVLEDIERHRPSEQIDARLSAYDQKYKEIRNALIQSFTKPQLQIFLHLYGLQTPPASKAKDIFAEIIMEKWGWEPLSKVQEERSDWTQTSELLYPLSPGSAFLLMGRDGADLLSLAQHYNVHLSFDSDPLSLKVRGLRGDVKRMEAHMKHFEEGVMLRTVLLPLSLSITLQMAQSISRLSGAYVETGNDKKLFVTYRRSKPESVEYVMRLAVQAASGQLDQNPNYVEWLAEKGESTFSFYPFYPSQISSRKLQEGSSFRVRRVGQWLRAGANYNIGAEELLDLTLSRHAELGGHLRADLSTLPLPNSNPVVTASTGHFLFLTPAERVTFSPPIKGNVGSETVLKWAKDHPTQVVFNPSVPRSCVLSSPHSQREVTRTVYKACLGNHKRRTLKLEIVDSPVALNSDPHSSTLESPCGDVICQRSVETHVDVLLPSRSTDIRISAANVENMSNIPQELRPLIKTKTTGSWANTPLALELDGLDYILSSTSKVQQRYHKMSGTLEGKPIQYEVVVETTLDSEVGQPSTVCKIVCHNPDHVWDDFLKHCDHLTLTDDDPGSEHPLEMIKPWFTSKRDETECFKVMEPRETNI